MANIIFVSTAIADGCNIVFIIYGFCSLHKFSSIQTCCGCQNTSHKTCGIVFLAVRLRFVRDKSETGVRFPLVYDYSVLYVSFSVNLRLANLGGRELYYVVQSPSPKNEVRCIFQTA